jgi:RNA polymerase-binding transcription factor DksA
MPAKPKTTGKKTVAKKAHAKPAPAKKVISKKAPAKPAPKAVKAAPSKAKAGKSKISPKKPATAAKPAPKAAAKSPSKTKPAKPAPKAKPAAPVKSKVKPKAAAPKPTVKAAKAKNAPKPIVKKAPAKSTPAAKKPVAKSKPAPKAPAKAPAKPAAKAPTKAATKAPAKPAAKAPAKAPAKAQAAKPAADPKAVKAAPPAPKRAPKATNAPPTPLGKMPRRRIDDEPEITIEPVKGPVKMTPWLIKQKKRLTELRDSYLNAIEGVANETIRMRPEDGANSAFGMHQADAGSDAYDRDFALSLLGKEQDALYEINEALKRIEQGVYGICEMSAEKISQERLEALPFTRYTVACQERIERQQMGGRGARQVRPLFGLDDAGASSGDSSDEEEGESLDSGRD